MSAVPPIDFVSHFDSGNPRHREWLLQSLQELTRLRPDALSTEGDLYAIWSGIGRNADGGVSAIEQALPLIKEFEGFSAKAYPDPLSGGEPWTIGYGTTRRPRGGNGSQERPVRPWETVTPEQAETLLRSDLARLAGQLSRSVPFWSAMRGGQRAALLSFAYNLGGGFYGGPGFETISKRLAAKEWASVPAALLLYCNPGTPVEAGLRRRREAEGKLWSSATPLPLPPPAAASAGANPLPVPYFSQRDSGTGQAERMCFSSSCAMLLQFLRPGALKGANGDDQYLRAVQEFGDTTDAGAQVKALAKLGVRSRFVQDADFRQIERQIDRGVPVPCGYLHRGPVGRPTGGGHWLIVIGCTAKEVIVHDPFGEPDLLSGVTLNSNGRALRFTRENFGRRWMVEPVGGGAYRYAPGKGWAIIAEP